MGFKDFKEGQVIQGGIGVSVSADIEANNNTAAVIVHEDLRLTLHKLGGVLRVPYGSVFKYWMVTSSWPCTALRCKSSLAVSVSIQHYLCTISTL